MNNLPIVNGRLITPGYAKHAGIGDATPAKERQRAKRFEGRASRRKAWLREMRQLPGLFIPMVTRTEANTGGGVAKMGRAKRQRATVAAEMVVAMQKGIMPKACPERIQFTRYGGILDEFDNARSAFKHIIDEVCKIYGTHDGPGGAIEFLPPKQVRCEFLGIRIEPRE